MPLALLSIYFGIWISRLLSEPAVSKAKIADALVGHPAGRRLTPLLELRRALVNGPSPGPLCSLVGVWNEARTR